MDQFSAHVRISETLLIQKNTVSCVFISFSKKINPNLQKMEQFSKNIFTNFMGVLRGPKITSPQNTFNGEKRGFTIFALFTLPLLPIRKLYCIWLVFLNMLVPTCLKLEKN